MVGWSNPRGFYSERCLSQRIYTSGFDLLRIYSKGFYSESFYSKKSKKRSKSVQTQKIILQGLPTSEIPGGSFGVKSLWTKILRNKDFRVRPLLLVRLPE